MFKTVGVLGAVVQIDAKGSGHAALKRSAHFCLVGALCQVFEGELVVADRGNRVPCRTSFGEFCFEDFSLGQVSWRSWR